MTLATRLTALERTVRPRIGPYRKFPPGPEFEATFIQLFTDVWERHTAHMTEEERQAEMERWQVVWRTAGTHVRQGAEE